MHDAQSRNSPDCETTRRFSDLSELFRARRYYMKMRVQQLLYVVVLFLATSQFSYADDWVMFGRTPAHASFARTEATLKKSVLSTLQPAWAQSFETVIAASPSIAGGILYFGGWNGYFYAVDGKDGRVLWQTFVGKAADPDFGQCQQAIGVSSQATISGDIVYVGGGDSAVYALKKSTGEQIWRVPLADPASGSYIWSSLTLVQNILYVGVASLGDCPLVRGALVRFDLNAPLKPLVRYLTTDDQVGAGLWSTPAIDVASNTVFVTTGTGEQVAGEGVWGGTLLALDATTLDIKAHYFLPTNSVETDIEWGSSPTVVLGGGGGQMIAATGKDGVLYALAANDLSFLYQVKLAVECICPECGCGSLSTPAFDGRFLYVGAGVADPELFDSGSVYSIDPIDGRVRWVRTTPGVVIAGVTVAGGLVFAGTGTGLNIFDADSGDLLWTDQDRGAMYSQPIVVDGTVYCAYVTGELVAWRPVVQSESTLPPVSRGTPRGTRTGSGSTSP